MRMRGALRKTEESKPGYPEKTPDNQSENRFRILEGCTVLDMPESKEMTEQKDWRAKQPSQAGYVSADLKW